MRTVAEISLVLFDLNGVLYYYDRGARIAHLAATTRRSADAVKAAIWNSGFEDAGDTGAFDAAAYLQGFRTRIGGALTEAEWLTAQQQALKPITTTLALLSRIRSSVRRGVLTNNNLLVLRHFATLYPQIAALIGERACVSAEFGVRKPDPEVYRRCLIRLKAVPEAALFVDDSDTNVAGARQAGLRAIKYTSFDALSADLRQLGLLN